MKILIMTWFSYYNYGTLLQVTGLCKHLEKSCHDVRVLQYYPCNKKRVFGLELVKKVKRRLCGNQNIIKKINGGEFLRYRNEYLYFTDECNSMEQLKSVSEQYDVVICGSDQIWSPVCFDPHYYLDFVEDERKMVAYAPSIGVSEITDEDLKRQIKVLTERFDYISLREKEGANIIAELLHKFVPVVLDPTFLLMQEEWEHVLELKREADEHYVLVYFLGINEEYWLQTINIAKKLDIAIRIVPVFQTDLKRDGVITDKVGPREFAELIMNADYVCTDSFHGVALSINFQKQFLCFERFSNTDKDNQNSRIHNILDSLLLSNRLYKSGKPYSVIEKIDYDSVFKRLEIMRKFSAEYLNNALNDIESSAIHNVERDF